MKASAPAASERRLEGPAQWVELFAEMWRGGTFESVKQGTWAVHPECRMYAPQEPVPIGPDGFHDLFRRLYALMPDVKATVNRWVGRDDELFMEFTLTGTLGGRLLSWDVVDSYRLQDGLIIERIAYFDTVPLLLQLLRRPRAWLRWWRSGLGYPRRRPSRRLLRNVR